MLSRKPTNPVLDKSHPLARGLVGWWALAAPGLVKDITGKNAPGSVVGAPTFKVDPQLGVCVTSGSDANHISLDTSAIPTMAEMSLSFWIRVDGSYVGDYLFFGDKNVYGVLRSIDVLDVRVISTFVGAVFLAYDIFDGAWHHFVVTYDGTNAHAYRNGSFLESNAATGAYNPEDEFGLLTRINSGVPSADVDPNVQLADFRMWSRALSPAEVLRTYKEVWTPAQLDNPSTVFGVEPAGGAYTPDLTTDGWSTIPAKHASAREIYVDDVGGSDSNDGLSSGAAKATLAAGYALMRDGYGDHLYLKAGGDWTSEGVLGYKRSGLSSDYPSVVAPYGDYETEGMPQILGIFSADPVTAPSHVHFYHIDMVQVPNDTSCAQWLFASNCQNVRFEGCWFRNGQVNVQSLDAISVGTDITFYRCVFYGSVDNTGSHAQGLFARDTSGLTIEQCVFDENGWDESDQATYPATIFNHNIYLQAGQGEVTVRKNLVARGSSHGVHHRCGGVNEDNTYFRNAINLQMGYKSTTAPLQAGGDIRRNVVLKGRDIDGADRHWGIHMTQADGIECSYNIVTDMEAGATAPIGIEVAQDDTHNTGSQNITIRKNIVQWGDGVRISNSATDNFSAIVVSDNDIQCPDGGQPMSLWDAVAADEVTSSDNTCYSTDAEASRYYYDGANVSFATYKSGVGDTTSTEQDLSGVYTDSSVTLDSYAVSVGLTDASELLTYARAQRKGNWDLNLTPDRINAYFRANFDMIPAPLSFTATKSGVDVDLESTSYAPESDSFVFQRSPNGVDTWTQIATPTSPSATDLNPGPGTWYYRCASVVDSVTGDWSDVVSVTFAAPGVNVGNFGFWW